jgi:2-(1,2-epoxy-1,2-dihydrophenyl)acetyl-CoA isomerase
MSELLHDSVAWDLDDSVARITLARGSGNVLDMSTSEGLREAANRVAAGAAAGHIRVAVIAADGPTFCVGGDLREFAAAADRGQRVSATAEVLHEAILTLNNVAIPLVSVVQGTVAGGGVGLALAADIVLMAADAKMHLAYTGVSLSPDCGATWKLAKNLSPAQALDFALTNRPLTGTEAAAWGLVSRSVARDELDTTAREVVTKLRSGPVGAYSETKRLLTIAGSRGLADQLEDEAATVTRMAASTDGIEGVNAFLQKRTPTFR